MASAPVRWVAPGRPIQQPDCRAQRGIQAEHQSHGVDARQVHVQGEPFGDRSRQGAQGREQVAGKAVAREERSARMFG